MRNYQEQVQSVGFFKIIFLTVMETSFVPVPKLTVLRIWLLNSFNIVLWDLHYSE